MVSISANIMCFLSPLVCPAYLLGESVMRNRPKFFRPKLRDPKIEQAKEEQRREFNSILEDVNKFVYSNMTSTRKERALKKQWENARAEALGCTPEKGVHHGFKHFKEMRAAKARKREAAAEKAKQGEDVDRFAKLNRDITEVRRMRKDKRKEKRDRNQSRGIGGETVGSRGDVNKLIKKFSLKSDSSTNTNGFRNRKQ